MFGIGAPEGISILVLLGIVVLYFLPAIIARSNKHSKAGAIFFGKYSGRMDISWMDSMLDMGFFGQHKDPRERKNTLI